MTNIASSPTSAFPPKEEAKALFQSEAIRLLTNEWLGTLVLKAVNLQGMSERQLTLYKSSAKRVLESKAYKGERDRLLEQLKSKIALQAANDVERAYLRGACLGLKMLEESLTILAPEANRKPVEDE